MKLHFERLDVDESCDARRSSVAKGTTSDSVDSAKTGTGWGCGSSAAMGVIKAIGELEKLCARISARNVGLAFPVADEDEDAVRVMDEQ